MCVSVGLYTSLYEAEQPVLLCQACVTKLYLIQRHFLNAGNSGQPFTRQISPQNMPHSTHDCINSHPIPSADSISLWHKGIYPLYRLGKIIVPECFLPLIFSCKIRDNIINVDNGWIWITDRSTDPLCWWSQISFVSLFMSKVSLSQWTILWGPLFTTKVWLVCL